MDSLVLLICCLAAGVLVQRSRNFPPNAAHTLNQYVLYAPLPALALYHIPEIQWGFELLFPVGVAWIGFGVAWLFFGSLRRIFGWSHKLTGCLILTAGLGNTSFVGFPVIEAAYGKDALAIALLVDLPKGLDVEVASISFEGVAAVILSGFWLQLAAGTVLTATGFGLAALDRRPAAARARSPRRPARDSGDGGSQRDRRSPATGSPA